MQSSKPRKDIVFIGPMCSGKTTISACLATITTLHLVHIDAIKYKFFKVLGYKKSTAQNILTKGNIFLLLDYEKQFEFKTLNAILANMQDSIVDIGAGFCFNEEYKFNPKVLKLLEKFPNTFLVLPDANLDKANDILSNRLRRRYQQDKQLHKYMSFKEGLLLNSLYLEGFYKIKSHFKVLISNKVEPNELTSTILSMATG